MEIKTVQKGMELLKKLRFIQKVLKDLKERTVIFVGGQRLDEHMEIHDELSEQMKDSLNRIEQEILDEIQRL